VEKRERENLKVKTDKHRSICKMSRELVESALKKKRKATVVAETEAFKPGMK